MQNLLINQNLTLVKQSIKKETKTVLVKQATNHIVVIDCSYSMASDLKAIAKQFKNKLTSLVKEKDTISIIWFSGRNECGILKEEVEISTLKDLSDLHNAIDRFLKPIGLTGFKEPLELAKEVIERISVNRKNTCYSLLFLTDGYDNQNSEKDILKTSKELSPLLSNATFVEYGYYANHNLLTKMSEVIGGSTIFSEGFEQYDPIFESVLSKNIMSSKKVCVDLKYLPKYDFVYVVNDDNTLTTYKIENNQVFVVEDTTEIFYLTSDQTNKYVELNEFTYKPVYSLIYLLSQRGKSEDIYAVIGMMGEVTLINQYCNSFGKQKQNAFQNRVLDIITEKQVAFADGINHTLIPNENAYCVLDLLNDLIEEGNKWYPSHESFKYKRIGSAKIQKSSTVTDEEVNRIKLLTEEISTTKDINKLKELQSELSTITDNKFELKFKYDEQLTGYPISELVYNENRPNISVKVKSYGVVELPPNDFNLKEIKAYRYNNYNIIRDGILNCNTLPVSLTSETFDILKSVGLIYEYDKYIDGFIYVLDLTTLPVINRSMVKNINPTDLFTAYYELTKLKAQQKVYNHFDKITTIRESKSFIELYGEETAKWLETLGITDYNGFNPKSVDAKLGENYMAVELDIKLAGVSGLPSVNDVLKKMNDPKVKVLTLREELLATALVDYNNFITSSIYTENEEKDELLSVWLKNKKKHAVAKVRELSNKIATIKFSIILGQVWPFDDVDTKTMELNYDNKVLKFELVLEDKEIEI